MSAAAKITLQSEISFEQLYQAIRQLSYEQRLQLADKIKREVLREQWQQLSEILPDAPQFSEDEILAEIKAVRTAR